jgi:putative ABC transport system permease protein
MVSPSHPSTADTGGPVRTFLAVLRPPVRSLIAHRGESLVALLTLALTIGVSTGVFSIVNGVVFRPLPFQDPDRIVGLCEVERGEQSNWCSASVPDVFDVAARSRTIAVAGVARSWPFLMKTPDGAVGVAGGLATAEAFEALGVVPLAGRLIQRDDIGGSWRRVVVLGNEIWRTRFGARSDVIGQSVTLDDELHTIVGVLPPDVRLPHLEDVQMWRPIHVDPADEERRDWRGFLAFARLRETASLAEARSEVTALAAAIQRDHFPTKPGWTIAVRPWHDVVVGPVRRAMYIFLGAVGLLLLIGCANVANLLLAQAAVRRREMAVRAALGAARGRLVRGLLLESLLLALGGAAGGVAIAWTTMRAFVGLAPRGIPRIDEVGLDGRVLAFTLAVSAVTTLLVGMAPALRATKVDLNRTLSEGGRSGTSRRANRIGGLLIVGEIALAVVLVTGAGLLGRSFATLLGWNPGFEQDHLVTAWAFTSPGKFERGEQVAELFARAEEELRTIPSVVSVGAGSAGPLFGGDGEMSFRIDGRAAPSDGSRQTTLWYDVSPGYFPTFGIPVVLGRNISDRDVHDGPKVAVVNERFARRYLGGRPLGRRIHMAEFDTELEVVGVVADVPPVRPGDEVPAQIFWSNRQMPRWATYFVVRTAGEPGAVARVIADRLHAVDPDMQVSQVRTMREVLTRELVRPRFAVALLGTFGALALLLAAIGTYGLLTCTVEGRTKEFGIRMALGAAPSTIVGEVVRRSVRLAAFAAALGIIASLMLTRLLASQLAGVRPNDPATLLGSAGVLVLVAVMASLIPAARASRVNPIVTLRTD